MAEFNFHELKSYFLEGLREAHKIDDLRKAQEHIDSLIARKSSQLRKPAIDVDVLGELKSILEFSFRLLFHELLDFAHNNRRDVTQVGIEKVIELALWCAQQGTVEPPLVFHLFEDLFDSQTIDQCQHLFSLLESRAPSLANDMFVTEKGRGRNLLLKVCTDLLKRLSKTNNAEFCGRILIFLAYVFPLSDRSGLNVKSEYNVANVTVCEEPPSSSGALPSGSASGTGTEGSSTSMDLEKGQIMDGMGPPIDYNFYRTFWGLQSYFQNHLQVFTSPERWPTLIRAIEFVLEAFAASSNLDEVVGTQSQNHYFTKYLTSSNLMKLQLKDSCFRRHILVQMLILFQALTVPTSKTATNTLKDKQKQTIAELTTQVKELLEGTHPNGVQFTRTVFDILQRENNWIMWKQDNCRPFERSPIVQQPQPTKRKRTTTAATQVAGKKVLLGNAELSRLWNLSTDNHEFLTQASRAHTPSVDDFLQPLLDGKGGNKVYTWRALRLIGRHRLRYFSELSGSPGNLEDVVRLLDKEKQAGQVEESLKNARDGVLDEAAIVEGADITIALDKEEDISTINSNDVNDNENDDKDKDMKVEPTHDDGVVAASTPVSDGAIPAVGTQDSIPPPKRLKTSP
jgi:THO complex subunit 1